MAEPKIGIEVTADVTQAKQSFDDLKEGIREQTTAAKAAGQEQKALAAQIARTKEAQIAAKEAVDRAKAALELHNATVQAHGKDSKEASESLARLKRAQEEAAKATKAARQEVSEAASATRTATAASDKMTPALKRAANEVRQVTAAADKAETEVTKLGLAIEGATKRQRSWGGALKDFAGDIKDSFRGFNGPGGVAMAFDALKSGIEWAAEHNANFGSAIERIAGSVTAFGEALLNGPIGRGLTSVVNGLATAAEAAGEWGEWLGLLEPKVIDTTEALVEYTKANEGALESLMKSRLATMLATETQERFNEQIRIGLRLKDDEAKKAFVIAGLEAREAREREARERLAKSRQAKSVADTEKVRARMGRGPAPDLSAGQTFRGFDGSGMSDALAVQIEQGGFERESAIREERLAAMDREIELMTARGDATEQLIDRRLAAEIRLADWQAQNTVTHAEREAATTRREQLEHKRRIAQIQRAQAEEAKVLADRQKVVERVTGAVTTLGDTLINGIEAAVQGEKGAVAQALADLLKAVAKKNAILALEQAALAVAAAASYNYVGAAQHVTAAGMHTAVAAAAGMGAVAAGSIASESRGRGASSTGSSTTPSGSGLSPRSGTRDEGLQRQETPVSHEQLRRAAGMVPAANDPGGGGVVVNINNPQIFGAGGIRDVAEKIRTEIERQNRGGKRARL